MTSLRWGIIGTGGIAAEMAGALRADGSEVTAVASSRRGAARAFAGEHGIEASYDSYGELTVSDDVDVVYVASTNETHMANSVMAIEAGKAVLCEKPLGINARQVERVLEASRRNRVFAMEAMWMRFLPFVEVVRTGVADGAIGELRHVAGTLSYPVPLDRTRRWLDPAKGGGALLDLGLYPMSLAMILAEAPLRTAASAVLADTGVDTQVVVSGTHSDGVTSSSMASFTAATPNDAMVVGTLGHLRIAPPMQQSTTVTLVRGDAVVETFDASFEGHGLAVEARHVAEMVGSGRIESSLWPLGTSLALVRWMDDVRSQIGVTYPEDEVP